MRHHWLTRAAWLNAGTHAAASLGMVALLRPGLPGPTALGGAASHDAGLQWAADHAGLWALGWGLWTTAAASFAALAIVAGLQRWHGAQVARRIGGWLAALIVIAAAGADVLGQGLMVSAAFGSSRGVWTLDYAIGLFSSGVLGNTLYAVGLLVLAVVWHPLWTVRTRVLGYSAGFLGLALTPLALDSEAFAWSVTIVTALLMSCVIAWSVSLALEPAPDER